MDDYIKREDAIKICKTPNYNIHDILFALKTIHGKIIPAANARENEYTTDKNGTPSLFECEKCGWEDWDTYTGDGFVYCPGCGRKIVEYADMRGDRDG